LKAYGLIKPDIPDCRLIVVSPQSRSREKYEKQVSDAGLKDVLFVNGRNVSDAEKPRYYSTADIYCAPATGHESFGIVLLEAMATGKPVIASNISGYAGVITDGKEGVLVPPKQEVPLAQAIARLIKSPETGKAMGIQGRHKSMNYGWDQIAVKVLDFYKAVLKNKRIKN
jgi:phosphatidyl-myo-inositol alpha-mannosyltransferase